MTIFPDVMRQIGGLKFLCICLISLIAVGHEANKFGYREQLTINSFGQCYQQLHSNNLGS